MMLEKTPCTRKVSLDEIKLSSTILIVYFFFGTVHVFFK